MVSLLILMSSVIDPAGITFKRWESFYNPEGSSISNSYFLFLQEAIMPCLYILSLPRVARSSIKMATLEGKRERYQPTSQAPS